MLSVVKSPDSDVVIRQQPLVIRVRYSLDDVEDFHVDVVIAQVQVVIAEANFLSANHPQTLHRC